MARAPQASRGAPDAPPTYWLTRFVLLRLLGTLYAVAFLVALIGPEGLQLLLLLSGNLSFPNWLTILPALAYFDDICWARLLSGRLVRWA